MFQPMSLQNAFSLVSGEDPGLELPADPEERETALRVARETGRYDKITRAGESLTVFRCESIHGAALTWFQGEVARRGLTDAESIELAFRLALIGIDNLGSFKPKFERATPRLLAMSSLDEIYDIGRAEGNASLGRSIVLELGAFVLERAVKGVPPK